MPSGRRINVPSLSISMGGVHLIQIMEGRKIEVFALVSARSMYIFKNWKGKGAVASFYIKYKLTSP